MLEYMRKNANSSVVWFIIGAIALVFVFFGVGGGGGGGYKSITVNGEEVNYRDYENIVQAMNRAQADNFEPGMEKANKAAAAAEVVNQALMRQFGNSMGLYPSDKALAAKIASNDIFQTDGRFDSAKYDGYLKALRTDKGRFEEQERKFILMSGVAELISGLARAHTPDIMEQYHFQEDQVALEYAFFPSDGLKNGLVPTDEQLSDYYLRNQARWRIKTSMKLEYVEIRPADFLDKAQVSDKELLDLYNESGDLFKVEDSANVSHILFRFPSMSPAAEEKEAALEKAKAAYIRAQKEDFVALARELSEDVATSAAGGDLGSVGRGLYFESMEKAIFSAPLNEVTEPVETSVGYHLFKVTGRQMAGLRPFEDVKETLAGERKIFKARELAVAQLEDLLDRAESNPKLAEAAKSMGLEVKVSDSFTEENPPAFFEARGDAVKKAFKAQVGRVASPVEGEDHLVVFTPLERVDSFTPPLDELKDKIVEAWLADEALRLARVDADHFIFLAQADWDKALADLSERSAVVTGKTPLSRRSTLHASDPALGQIGDFFEFMGSVAYLSKVGQVSPEAVAGQNKDGQAGIFVLRLADFKAADDLKLSGAMLETYSTSILMTKANFMFQGWREALSSDPNNNVVVPDNFAN